ncbi:OmpA family protein [Dawidia soli]|uniref:PD40 domain-containing protein n=1 Tax=Dawidia soli TaxID=2782352 RepID=A0AAP2DF80_9BACT|nr:OmpA family protein [Dawidia soli]MBT1689620.1 PD40 domain-containing protein [Dawidia soli]
MHRLLLLLAFVLLSTGYTSAQVQLSTKSRKAIDLYTQADNFRVRRQFNIAIDMLQQAIEKDEGFVEAYYRLGLVYSDMKNPTEAIRYYEQGLARTTDVNKQKVFWFDLGEAYFTAGNYEKAAAMLDQYLKKESQNRSRLGKAAHLLKSAEFALKNQKETAPYKQKALSDTVNCFAMQYFPVLTADQQKLIFTRRVTNDPNADEDLVVSQKDVEGRWTAPQSISKNINTQLNEGTSTISADGRKLIFTACVGRPDIIGSCDLYESHRIGSDWTKPVNLGPNVNSTAWESQPSLSADGRTLYFVSDRRAGMGRRDIWMATLDDYDRWTKAVNVGKPVNSPFDEISPFIHANNHTLYFASNGLPGFGGYDIFFVEKDTAGWTNPQNIGAPINSHEDQFSLFVTADGKKGYYSHEETTGPGTSRSRIFELEFPEGTRLNKKSNYVRGIVRDKQSRQPLAARVELVNLSSNQVVALVTSDSISGEYLMVLPEGADYALYVSKTTYLFKSLHFNYAGPVELRPVEIDVDLEKAAVGSGVVLNNIFFDVDRFELKQQSIPELEKIYRFLTDNPTLKIEISGHTDNSGAAAHNRQLSEKRALSVYNYLISKGIVKNRLIPKGYGPDKPIASNDAENGRQLNRRIEFTIVR